MDGWNSKVWEFTNSRKIKSTTFSIGCYGESGIFLCEKLSGETYFVERKVSGTGMFTWELVKYGLL